MGTTKSRKKRTPAAPAVDTRQTVSPLDESLPKQTPSLDGQQTLPVDLPPGKPPAGQASRRASLPPGKPPARQVRPGLVEWLKQFDMEAFLNNWSPKEMRRRIDARYGTTKRTRVSAKEFAKARVDAFDWWKARRLCCERSSALLTGDQWDRMKQDISKVLDLMHGRTLRQCVRIARTVTSCSSAVLQGLPRRFHVWKD